MDLFTAIETRRSNRRFQTRPVATEMQSQILEAARRAPSWANAQTARYVMVTDAALKETLAETMPETNPGRAAMTQAPLVVVA